MARSRVRPSTCSLVRIDQTCFKATTTPVAPAVSRVFAFLMQAEQPIAVDQKSPGGSDSPRGLILQHGERSLWKAVKRVEAKETEADIILSTAHKSKGSEWDLVRLAQDFDRHIMSCQLSRRWH